MKYMILTYASQRDYDGLSDHATGERARSQEQFGAMGAFMESFKRTWSSPASWSRSAAFGVLARMTVRFHAAPTAVAMIGGEEVEIDSGWTTGWALFRGAGLAPA